MNVQSSSPVRAAEAKLSASDYQSLKQSYITPELAEAAGLFRVTSEEGRELIGANRRRGNCAGIIFPYRWPGETNIRSHRLRRDQPERERKTDGSMRERGKYLGAPGDRNRLYFAPSVRPDWLTNANIPAIFVEGEKKALSLQRFFDECAEAVLIVGLSGVENWRGKIGLVRNTNGHKVADVKGVIPDVERIAWQGRGVEIIFDADSAHNPAVKAARRRLSDELVSRGAAFVRVLEMPPLADTGCKGIDDLLGQKGSVFVAEWLRKARNLRAASSKKTSISGAVFKTTETGVFAIDPETGNEIFVCSPLEVRADTCNERNEDWGRLLVFPDRAGKVHQWAMPMALLGGDGRECRQEVLSRGLVIGSGSRARNLFEQYLSIKPDKMLRSVSRTGWYHNAYILPEENFGAPDGEEIVLQMTSGNDLFQVSGTIDDWREQIASYCVNNSRLVFAVSVAFAAPLLRVMEMEGGGFHYRGASSTGKTTALLVAGSVWGGNSDKGFLRRWRATINGLESVAETHNDALLCLDELSEVDPREAGEAAYMLANGQGKLRQSRSITLRRSLEWRLLFLSSGEVSLSDHIAQVGKRSRGGQEVRLVDIEAEAGTGLGLFEDLHSFYTADELARHLRQASLRSYGAPLREFLRQLVIQPEAVCTQFKNYQTAFLQDNLPASVSGEVVRVAHRFALVGFAGELAGEYSLTGWPENEATKAASVLFRNWLARRGAAGTDEEAMIRQVRLFVEQHGASRFQNLDRTDERIIHNRAGYVETTPDGAVYYFTPEVFRAEVCKGFDATQVTKALEQRGCLRANHGRQFKRHDLETRKTRPFFAVTDAIFD